MGFKLKLPKIKLGKGVTKLIKGAGKLVGKALGISNPWTAAAVGLGAMALGKNLFKKKKVKPEVVPPAPLPTYMSPEQIAQSPISQALFQSFQGWSPATAAYRFGNVLGGLGGLAAAEATRPTDWYSVVSSVAAGMRPLFEQQLGRQLQFAHEQLAAAAGSPSGGAITEALRRQLMESELGWQNMLMQMGLQELARQEAMRQQWANLAQQLYGGAMGLYAMPTEMQLRIASALQPLYGGTVAYPMYGKSLAEQLAEIWALGRLVGG